MALVVLGVSIVAVAGVAWFTVRGRPETRKPGEDLPEITQRLAVDLPAEAPMPRFTDVTAEAGLAEFDTFVGDRSSQLPEDMGAGAAWGDFDNDGDDDLFLVGGGGTMAADPATWATSELFENLGDGTFSRVESFPATRGLGMAAAWGDVDGDGWLDLATTGYDGIVLYRNREGSFEVDQSLSRKGYWAGASWGDFDNDRDLDLYVCGYVEYEPMEGNGPRGSDQYGRAVPYTLNPASFEPLGNLLFQNDGNGAFEEVALLYGVSNPEGRSLGALWRDFDDDGRLDLYVANDISDNALYLNRGDTFEDAGLAAWVADYRGAMGLTAGDWNRDGDDDLFVTHWVAQENALYDSRLANAPPSAEGAPAPPRALTFSDVAAPMGLGQIALQSIGWGTEFADFDSDGWLDLAVSNGSTFETADQPPQLQPQLPFLFWNQAGSGFHDLAPLSPPLSEARVGRGLALSDYDSDGDMDILWVTLDDGVHLLRNETEQGNWLEIDLRSRSRDSSPSEGWGDGATVIVTVGDLALRRTLTGASYLSQSSRTLHFGLGASTSVDAIEVRWLGGEAESYDPVPVNARWELTEGGAQPRRLSLLDDRERVMAFWDLQRRAMDTMKLEGDSPRAIGLFRQALELNPDHGDSRYYLANLLAGEGDVVGALAELETLIAGNPMSHRGHKQWGLLKAIHAAAPEDLAAAEAALETALGINQEETGTLLALGETALLRGDVTLAEERLRLACQSNPRAVGGFFLRAYISWTQGDRAASVELLRAAQTARGDEWKPEGAAAEGDVARLMHREETPLWRFWREWDGGQDPATAFRGLQEYLGQA